MMDLVGSFLAIRLVQFPVMWLFGDINHFNPLLGWVWEQIRSHPKCTSDRACTLPYFPGEALRVTFNRILRMRAHHPSGEKPHLGGYCATSGRACAHPTLPRNSFGVAWLSVTSHPVAMLLPVMRNGRLCTTTIVRKKSGENLGMRTRSLPVMCLQFRSYDFRSGPLPVTSLPVAPPRFSSNVALAVLIYYYRGFESRSGPIKDYRIGMCCFSAKHAALRRKSKDWLTRNQNNVSEWSDMSTRGLLFQWASTIKIQLSALV